MKKITVKQRVKCTEKFCYSPASHLPQQLPSRAKSGGVSWKRFPKYYLPAFGEFEFSPFQGQYTSAQFIQSVFKF